MRFSGDGLEGLDWHRAALDISTAKQPLYAQVYVPAKVDKNTTAVTSEATKGVCPCV